MITVFLQEQYPVLTYHQCECNIPVKVSSKPRGLFLLEPFSHLPTTSYVIGAKSVNIVENGTSCVRLLNPTNKNVQIRPGKVVASAYSISESDICESNIKAHMKILIMMGNIFQLPKN